MRLEALAALISREWRVSWADRGAYVLRASYASALLVAAVATWLLLPVLSDRRPEDYPETIRAMFGLFCRAQFVLVSMLAAMTFARAVCRELERGTMDLLILSPLSRWQILAGKVAGEFLGLAALIASGIPSIFLLIPVGGISAGQILALQGTILAQVLFAGGLCVALASAFGRTLPVMICAWALMAVFPAVGLVGRWAAPGLPFWAGWEAFSAYHILDGQLASVWAEPMPALSALGLAVSAAIVFCGLGSLVVERQVLRGAGVGVVSRLGAALRRSAGTLSGRRLFRPLMGARHPLVERECSVYRDLPFRLLWILLTIGYGVAARIFLERHLQDAEAHAALATGGLAAGSLVVILTGALNVGYDRRRGVLLTLLASGVAPEDIVRSKMAGMMMRAVYLLAVPLVHLLVAVVWMKAFTPGELAWRIPAGLLALALSLIVVIDFTLQAALSFRRPEAAALVGVLAGLPTEALLWIFIAGTPVSFAVGAPLIFAGILVTHARSIRRLPKWVLA